MSQSPEEEKQRLLREFEGKNVAHYSVMLQAWVDTRMERDRTIVTLSAAAIGLLATILTTVGVMHSGQIYLYGFAFIGFLVATVLSLLIYHRNSIHIEGALKGTSEQDPVLTHYDKAQMASFIGGAVLAAWIGIDSAIVRLKGDTTVNDKANSPTHQTSVTTNDSLHGISRLVPQDATRSLNGIANLAPQAPTQQPSASSAQSQAPLPAGQPDTGTTSQTTGPK